MRYKQAKGFLTVVLVMTVMLFMGCIVENKTEQFTVTYDANDANASLSKPSDTVYLGDAVSSLPTVTKTPSGKKFGGFNTQRDGKGSSFSTSTTIYKNMTVYAVWKTLYTITYDENGGTLSKTSEIVAEGETVESLPTATTAPTGTLGGFNTLITGMGIPLTTDTRITGNMTVYAIWTNFNALDTSSSSSESKSIIVNGSDIYASGTKENASYTSLASLWKNDEYTQLTSNTSRSSYANALVNDGTNILAIGYQEIGSTTERAGYWTFNGSTNPWSELDTASGGNYFSRATSVTKNGSDLYISGFKQETSSSSTREGGYWDKNGDWVKIERGIDLNCNAIATDGTYMYLGGNQKYTNLPLVAGFWKYTMSTSSTEWIQVAANTDKKSEVTSLILQDSKLYMAGYQFNDSHSVAGYCVNEADSSSTVVTAWTALDSGTTISQATSIAFSDSKTYIGGFIYNEGGKAVAGYWIIDGSGKTWMPLGSGSYNSQVNSVYISGNQLYLAGKENSKAGYWVVSLT